MSETIGIKETKEAVGGALALAGIIASHLKDGAQWSDVASIVGQALSDEDIKAALENAGKIPSEVGDLKGEEWGELIAAAMPGVIALIEALVSKPKP